MKPGGKKWRSRHHPGLPNNRINSLMIRGNGPICRLPEVLMLLFLGLFFLQPISTQAEARTEVGLLVRLASGSTRQQLTNTFQVPVLDIGLGELGIYGVVTIPGKMDSTLEALRKSTLVLDVEPNYPIEALDTTPNDPAFPDQYGLAAIHAVQGWSTENGSRNIRIAILDTGVDFHHPDLSDQLLPGFDIYNDDAVPQDDHGHGTAVTGIAAATTNNGIGMAGVGWQVQIMPVKVLGSSGSGTYGDVAAGIMWATSQGAQVINMSLGGASPSFTLEFAVNYAASKGILLVAASGNNGNEGVLYPARYPQVIAVAATDQVNKRASFSTFGPEVDVAAPGVQVYTTALGGGYAKRSGTSFSTPHVSGLAGLLFSMPGQVTASQVRAAIESGSLDTEQPGWDPYTGSGLIQVDAAMAAIVSSPSAAPEQMGATAATEVTPPLGTPGPSEDQPENQEAETGSSATALEKPKSPSSVEEIFIINEYETPYQNMGPGVDQAPVTNSSVAWLGLGLTLTGIALAIYYYWLGSYGRR